MKPEYILTKFEANQVERKVVITDRQMDVLFLALSELIESYENFDSDYLAEECAEDLMIAKRLDEVLGSLFMVKV
jgi:hypothetical protein